MIAAAQRLPMDQAFTRLRSHARNHNQRLADVASNVVKGTLDPDTMAAPRH